MHLLQRLSRIDGMRRSVLSLLGVLSILLSACTGSSDARIELAVSQASPMPAGDASARDGAAALNAMGLDLFGELAAPDQNAVISPLSIGIALGMARAGARGTTADEMDAVMHDAAADDHANWLSSLGRELAQRNRTITDEQDVEHEIALHLANAPFAQRGFSLHQAFLDALAARFGAGLRLVDFIRDSEGSRQAINGWVNEQTRDRIPELLPNEFIDGKTRLVLVNAVYLNAPWAAPWGAADGGSRAFTRPDGSIVRVAMMTTDGQLPYAEGDGWQAVELPYLGNDLAMLLVVPEDLAAFEANLDGESFAAVVNALGERQTLVTMPKFEVETQADLIPPLKSLGVRAAFDDADFSGISDAPLYVSGVVHQANISVDEKGTEAAAATAVGMAVSAPYGEVEVRADRPFLFAVRDRQTGAVLFLGHVADPSAGA
jgi:serpin B